jgi:hypothetical protein
VIPSEQRLVPSLNAIEERVCDEAVHKFGRRRSRLSVTISNFGARSSAVAIDILLYVIRYITNKLSLRSMSCVVLILRCGRYKVGS